MVKSIFRKSCYINFFVLILFASFSGFMTYEMVSIHFFKGDLFKTTLTMGESLVFIFIFGFITISTIKLLLVHYVNITVDTKNQEIVFVHMFLGIKKTYSFSDFDYYFETIEHSIGDSSKAIYLVKNESRVRAIRGYYYSNVTEMKVALTGISDYGFKKLSRLKVLALYFSEKL